MARQPCRVSMRAQTVTYTKISTLASRQDARRITNPMMSHASDYAGSLPVAVCAVRRYSSQPKQRRIDLQANLRLAQKRQINLGTFGPQVQDA